MSLPLWEEAVLLHINLLSLLLHLPFQLAALSNRNHYLVALGLVRMAPRSVPPELLMDRKPSVAVLALEFELGNWTILDFCLLTLIGAKLSFISTVGGCRCVWGGLALAAVPLCVLVAVEPVLCVILLQVGGLGRFTFRFECNWFEPFRFWYL